MDAFNVLHAAPKVHPGLEGLALSGLARLVQGSRWSRDAVFVCDGAGAKVGIDESLRHPEAPVRVIFAGPGRDADSLIARLVEEQERIGRAGSTVVVSSDKQVLASAIGPVGVKAKRMTSEQFVRELVAQGARGNAAAIDQPIEKTESLDAEGVERWLRTFGVDLRSSASAASPPGTTARAAGEERASESKHEDPLGGIDPADLDMKKWLR